MTKFLDKLRNERETEAIIGRAARRNSRYGSGDNYDFALFVIDETRKQEKSKRKVSIRRVRR